MKRILSIFTISLFIVAFASCGGNKSKENLVSKKWSLEMVEYADSNYTEHPPVEITMEFDDSLKMMMTYGGCNFMRGPFTLEDGNKIIFGNLISTRRFCEHMDFEYRYSKVLQLITRYTASEHELILTNDEENVTLRFLEAATEVEEVKQHLDEAKSDDSLDGVEVADDNQEVEEGASEEQVGADSEGSTEASE